MISKFIVGIYYLLKLKKEEKLLCLISDYFAVCGTIFPFELDINDNLMQFIDSQNSFVGNLQNLPLIC